MTDSKRFTNFTACALLVLAGCSSGASAVPASSAASPQAKSPRETLQSTHIAVKVESCTSGISGVTTFTAKGDAKGAFAGKFSAKGQWNFTNVTGVSIWSFAETFKITGAKAADGTVTGNGTTKGVATCKTFGPGNARAGLQYHLETLSGSATTNLLKNGSMMLEELH